MGNLLKLLAREDTRRDDLYDVFVDFENCEPSEIEAEVYGEIDDVLKQANIVLKGLREYAGAQDVIRDAISNPQNEELQEKAWVGVCPLVEQLKQYYEFSLSLEKHVPSLLQALCSNDMTPKEHLEKQQALVKQFAEILDFVIKFDDIKMTSPVVQNDFSYYRRTQSRRRMVTQNASTEQNNECVPHEVANRMSLFYAHATPMLKMLSDTTSSFVSKNKDLPVENTTDCLGTMANICRVMIENPEYCQRFKNQETKSFCLRVMVGVIILYDHVHPVGAFAKSSGIDIKSSIKLLREQRETSVEGLLNALRYTTKHLNDETTPKSVKALLLD